MNQIILQDLNKKNVDVRFYTTYKINKLYETILRNFTRNDRKFLSHFFTLN